MGRNKNVNTLAGIFVLVMFGAFFAAAWAWIWDIRITWALLFTGGLAFVFGALVAAANDRKETV